MNDRGGFFDDYDDEAPTNLPAQPHYQPSQQPPPPNYPHQYDEADAPTRLPGGQPGSGGFGQQYEHPTRLPGQSAGGFGSYDQGADETMLGLADEDVQPIGFLLVKRPLIRRGHVFRLPAKCTIGRTQGQIRLDTDRRVSGQHARIRLTEDAKTGEPVFILIDMDSTTGTYLNDSKERIDGRTSLNPGDEIRIGDYVFVFMMLKD